METPVLAAVATFVVVLLVGVVLGLVLVVRRSRADRRRLEEALVASREDVAALRARVDEVAARPVGHADGRRTPEAGEFVITTLPDGSTARPSTEVAHVEPRRLAAGEFASVAVGESLVRIVSFGYGVRRALTPENRNRIRFEIRREVRRSRKQRRRDVKEAKRYLRADQRTQDAA